MSQNISKIAQRRLLKKDMRQKGGQSTKSLRARVELQWSCSGAAGELQWSCSGAAVELQGSIGSSALVGTVQRDLIRTTSSCSLTLHRDVPPWPSCASAGSGGVRQQPGSVI